MKAKQHTSAADGAQMDAVVRANEQLVFQLNHEQHSPAETRSLLAKITGHPLDPTTIVRLPWLTNYGHNTRFGKNDFININTMFDDLGGITIGDNVLIAPNVQLLTVNHPLDAITRRDRHVLNLEPIMIEDDAWIGAGATITPGVTVGHGAVVAAAAVVTHDVAPNTVVAGVPAKVIRNLN